MAVLDNRKDLLKNRAYFLYLTGTTVSFFGTGMQYISNSWFALQMTGSSYSVALVLICSSLPGVLLSPFSGVFIDWMDRKKLAAMMDFFRALVLLWIPLIWWLGSLQVWHLYAMAFLVGLGDVIYQPPTITLIREIIPKHWLLMANSTTQTSAQIGALIGSALGGMIVAFWSPVWVMLINAITFLFSFVCILNMRKGQIPAKRSTTVSEVVHRFQSDLVEGFQYIRVHPRIISVYLLLLIFPMTLRSINVLLPPFTKDILQVDAIGLGYIDAAFAIGAIFGGLYLPVITKRYGNYSIMTMGMGALAASLLFFSLSQNLLVSILCYLFIGLTFQVRILYATTAQQMVDLDYQGRVHSVFTTIVSISSFMALKYMDSSPYVKEKLDAKET